MSKWIAYNFYKAVGIFNLITAKKFSGYPVILTKSSGFIRFYKTDIYKKYHLKAYGNTFTKASYT